MENRVFISYCWKDEDIVNKIDNYFKSRQIIFDRDKREIKSWESIKEFMKRIRASSYAILVVSDGYLKSINCMYEVLEVMKDEDYRNRILTVVLEDAAIYDLLKRTEYIKYWNEKYNKLLEEISIINDHESSLALNKELKKIGDIKRNVGEFIQIISDMNNPNIENICEEINKKLYDNGIEMDDEIIGLEEFLNELDECSYIETSIYPEQPSGEEKYIFNGANIRKGIHGINIEFNLNSVKEGKSIKLSIIDIIEVEKNTIESFEHKKFYMWCKNRIKEAEYREYMEMKKLGIVNDSEKEYELLDETVYCHRCILWYF